MSFMCLNDPILRSPCWFVALLFAALTGRENSSRIAFTNSGEGAVTAVRVSEDCNHNGVPDHREPDCNANGFPDDCDVDGTGDVEIEHRGLPESIPDASTGSPGVMQSVLIAAPEGCPSIFDLDLELFINHPRLSDLKVTLRHPLSGTEACLFDRQLGDAHSLFVTLDDEAAIPITDAVPQPGYPEVQGRFAPEEPLAKFDALDTCGHWLLIIEDHAEPQVGSLHYWALQVGDVPPEELDCNQNQRPDPCDLQDEISSDEFGIGDSVTCMPNGIPDECELPIQSFHAFDSHGDPQGDPSLELDVDGELIGCQSPNQGFHGGWSMVHADADFMTSAADNVIFEDPERVDALIWWGAYERVNHGLQCWPVPQSDQFMIRILEDVEGAPGDVLHEYWLEPQKWPTGLKIKLEALHLEYVFRAELDPGWTAEPNQPYWIEITNTTVDDCAWSWETAPPGDALAMWNEDGSGFLPFPFDLALCTVHIPDCNGNDVYDLYDIENGTSVDCQFDGVPDECQQDIDENGIQDACDILAGAPDANFNGIPDSHDCVTMPTDADQDCDTDLADFLLRQRCPSYAAVASGCFCFDVDHDGVVTSQDDQLFVAALLDSESNQARCTPRHATSCPIRWVLEDRIDDTARVQFSGSRVLPPAFFGSGSLPWEGEIPIRGRSINPTGKDATVGFVLESPPIRFHDETCASVPVWLTAWFVESIDPITVEFEDGHTEAWSVIGTLSPAFPGVGELNACLDALGSADGVFDLAFSIQPRFIFLPVSGMENRIPPECQVARVWDSGSEGWPPFEMEWFGQSFRRFLRTDEDLAVDPCPGGAFVPGYGSAPPRGAGESSACLSWLAAQSGSLFDGWRLCLPTCQPTGRCRYHRQDPARTLLLDECQGIPALPATIPGPACRTLADCPESYAYPFTCINGGLGVTSYKDPECRAPEPLCRGACVGASCECAIREAGLCVQLGEEYLGHGSLCHHRVDMDANSDGADLACRAISGEDTEEWLETIGANPVISVNFDDDNENGIWDYLDIENSQENDLGCIRLSHECSAQMPLDAMWSLSWQPELAVSVWLTPTKTGPSVESSQVYHVNGEAEFALPNELYVEGLAEASVSISFSLYRTDGSLIGTDQILIPVTAGQAETGNRIRE